MSCSSLFIRIGLICCCKIMEYFQNLSTEKLHEYVHINIFPLIHNFINMFQLTTAIFGIILILIMSTSLVSMLCIIRLFNTKQKLYSVPDDMEYTVAEDEDEDEDDLFDDSNEDSKLGTFKMRDINFKKVTN